MRFGKVLPGIVVLILVCLFIGNAVRAQGMPHVIIGVVTDESGATVPGATVTLTNSRTSGVMAVTADTMGQYQADLSTAPSGYQIGDVLKVRAASGKLVGSAAVTVSSGPLDQCDIVVSEKAVSPLIIGGLIGMLAAVIILAALFLRRKGPENASDKGRRRR